MLGQNIMVVLTCGRREALSQHTQEAQRKEWRPGRTSRDLPPSDLLLQLHAII